MSQRPSTLRVLRAVQQAYSGGADTLPKAYQAAAVALDLSTATVERVAQQAHLAFDGRAMTYLGRPCKKKPAEHDGTRYVSTGHCVYCARETSEAQYAAKKRSTKDTK